MQILTLKPYQIYLPFLFIFLLWFSSCATSKKAAYSPVGTWNYTVQGTPNGNITGKMIIDQAGDTYTGHIQSDMGKIPMEDLTIKGKDMTSNLVVNGSPVTVQGAFDENIFSGKVKVGYDTYDITANKAE